MKKRRSTPEVQLHKSVAEFLDWVLLPPTVYTTFPAGWGWLGRATAGLLKACGLKDGMPDILIFFNGRTFGVELKVGKNKQSAEQERMQQLLAAVGVPVCVCYSVDDVLTFLYTIKANGVPIPMREVQLGGYHGPQRQAPGTAHGAGPGIA